MPVPSPPIPAKLWRERLTVALLLAVLVALPLTLGIARGGEGWTYDLLLRLQVRPPSPRVLRACIDDATYKDLGGRDPNRAEIAEAVGNLWARGASLIGLDLLFWQPKEQEEAGNEALESALSKADVVLASDPAQGYLPIQRFSKQAVGLGSVDLVTDSDGILRSLPGPFFEPSPGGLRIKALPFALACALLEWFPKGVPQVSLKPSGISFGPHLFAMRGGRWWIPYCGGDGTLPHVSFIDVLRDSRALPSMKGRIVLVGNTRPSEHDYFSVPLPSAGSRQSGFNELSTHSMAGVEVHGQALSALLLGRSILPVSSAQRWAAFVLLASVGTLLVLLPLRPIPSLVAWLSVGAALAATGVAAIRSGHALPMFSLGLGWIAYSGASFAYQRYGDFRQKRAVERLFSRYVSPNIASKLLREPDLVQLGGRRKELTILFSDIRGFTNLSEQIPPEQVSSLLNEYFTEMTRILFEYDGTLDKFIGDAILAFFGDPVNQEDHPARALACAVTMQERAASLRVRFEAEGKPPLHMGVAVHTGPVVVGNNGSENNFVYTVIGDTVNLTSRLQGLAQQDDVIVTASTAERIPGFNERYENERLDPVRVKGKAEPIEIVRVKGLKNEEASHER